MAQSPKRRPPIPAPAPKQRKKPLRIRLRGLVRDMVDKGIRLDEAQRQMEREFLIEVLEVSGGNQCRAAEKLQVHRNTLRRKLRQHGLL